MTINCEIKFDQNNKQGVFFAGQLVSGVAQIGLAETTKFKAIRIEMGGKAWCIWSEGGQGATFTGKEKYFKTSTFLVPNTCVGDGFDLPPGNHTYKFECTLPEVLPSSFEGGYGHIRYTIKLVLERTKKCDHNYKVGFTVLQQLNLNNLTPSLRIPEEKETTKQFVADLFRSNNPPFSLVAKLSQTGYVPGQTIAIAATVANSSSVTINSVKFSLCKTLTYISSRPRNKKRSTSVLQKHKDTGVAPRSTGHFQAELYVPPVAPSNQGVSKVINIEYWVKIEAKASGPHFSPSVVIPITIGTIPLASKDNPGRGFSAALLQQSMPTFPANSPILKVFDTQSLEGAGGATVYPWESLDTEPPSYQETFRDDFPIVDDEDDNSHFYTPLYPVYSFPEKKLHL